jgi:radical SAM protein with 4Fe4S-binding SPASM domain
MKRAGVSKLNFLLAPAGCSGSTSMPTVACSSVPVIADKATTYGTDHSKKASFTRCPHSAVNIRQQPHRHYFNQWRTVSDIRAIPMISYGTFSQQAHDRALQRHQVVNAQLELTYRCNLRCRHCYTDPYNKARFFPRELSRDELYRILDELRDLGVIWLNLTGGDIFMHPDFFELYERAYQHGFLLQLYTNGTLFTRAVIQRLQAMPPFTIDVSCHTVNETRFDWFTQVPGSYRAFLRGMVLLKDSGLPFTIKTKLMNWNKDELNDLRAFSESFGQPFSYTTSLSPRLDGDCSSLTYRISPDDLRTIGKHELGSELDEGCSKDSLLSRPESDQLFRCGCGTSTIHINAWGELSTCTFQYETRVSLKQIPLREAVDRVFAGVRSLLYQCDTPCRSCTVHRFCDKQPTQARWEAGSPDAPIPYACDVAYARAQVAGQSPLQHPLRPESPQLTHMYLGEKGIHDEC